MGSMLYAQVGLAIAVTLIDRIGVEGAAWLRLAWAGVLMLVIVRPRVAAFTWRRFRVCVVLGRGDGDHHAAVHGRHRPHPARHGQRAGNPWGRWVSRLRSGKGGHRVVWPGLAAFGVVLLTQPWDGAVDPDGTVLGALGGGRVLARLHPAHSTRR